MVAWGFACLPCETCIYYRQLETGTIIAAVHVDDFLFIANTRDKNKRFKVQMCKLWTILDLGRSRHIIGVSVSQNDSNCTVFFLQTAFIERVVQQFGQTDAYLLSLPIEPRLKLQCTRLDMQTKEKKCKIAKLLYRLLVGCLWYIAITTQLDIAFAIQQLFQYLNNYDTSHWNTGIHLLYYLKGTKNFKLNLGGPMIMLRGFTDAD